MDKDMIEWLEPSIQASIEETAAAIYGNKKKTELSEKLKVYSRKIPEELQQSFINDIETIVDSFVYIAVDRSYRDGFNTGNRLP